MDLQVLKDSISVAFLNTEYQRCIVHQIRNTLKHVADKNKKEFAKDLKSIYYASTEEQGYSTMIKISEKWQERYPSAMKSWSTNWNCICPIFRFSADVSKVIYTTNAMESINSSYRRLNRQRSVFPSDIFFTKSLVFSNI